MQHWLRLTWHQFPIRILRKALAAGLFFVGAAQAQDLNWRDHPWVQKPSTGLAAKFRQWRLIFKAGEEQSAPNRGIFFVPGTLGGTARLVNKSRPSSIQLTPVAKRVRYVPRGEGHTDPDDRDVTGEIINTLRSLEVTKFTDKERLNGAHLDVSKHFAVALVQDFDVTLRNPGQKEHVWSINWRVERQTETGYNGYEAWGLFTRSGGLLRPFYLAGRVSDGGAPNVSYYYLLATGDLDGDGIDEMIAAEAGFEKEQDDVELWAWERGAPVTIHRMPLP